MVFTGWSMGRKGWENLDFFTHTPLKVREEPNFIPNAIQEGLKRRSDRRKIKLDKHPLPCYNSQALRGAHSYRGVEQLEARRAHNPEVVGSSPASATMKSPEIVRFQDFFLRFNG